MDIRRYSSLELKKSACIYLAEVFEYYKESPILFMSSGGSSLGILDEFVAIDASVYRNMTITVLDFRYTAQEGSNFFELIQKPFYAEALRSGAGIIDPRPQEGEALDRTGVRFDESLHAWKKDNPEGLIIATLGIGEDGHTAGMFPLEDIIRFNKLFVDTHAYAVGYSIDHAQNPFPERITVTVPFLMGIHHALVFASGEGKREALSRISLETEPLFKIPARVIASMPDVAIFTDIAE